jgi:uncharacterized membrane protein YdbT with pleckstrin-like domain
MMYPADLSKNGRRLLGMVEFDDQEQLICEFHKHPFGLTLIYIGGFGSAAFIMLMAVALVSFMPDSVQGVGDGLRGFAPLLIGLGALMGAFISAVTFAAAYIYRSNTIIVTSQKIAQILQKSLVTRKVSQLSIGDIQDVTVHQDDLFARIFHYGTLVIETSGEQANYRFTYVPNPYDLAKQIVGAHERDLALHGN